MPKVDFAIGIGGEAGQGIATPGDILARIFARRGLSLQSYNAYQSIIRGGHTFLTIRTSDGPVRSMGDKLDVLIALNQDTMDRHLKLMKSGSVVLFDAEKVKPGTPEAGVQLCPMPVKTLQGASTSKLNMNTMGIAATLQLVGIEFAALENVLSHHFKRKGDAVVAENVNVAKAAYDHASTNFKAFSFKLPDTGKKLAFNTGNNLLAMGGAVAGCKFYVAYPMSPSTGILMWMAKHARQLGILVRQVEDEISVINMVVGGAHSGCRSMCATSGGGFALMTEALGAAAMMEVPVVCINVMRAGPATGVPTKTEQGDLWQAFGSGQGDYPRIIVAPTNTVDAHNIIPEVFNLTDKYQCPAIVLSDLLISENVASFDPAELNTSPKIDRGAILPYEGNPASPASGANDNAYLRYKITPDGISPRALPGTPGHLHVVSTDEHDEDGVLISDEYTNPHKRRAMHEKRMRKMDLILKQIEAPKLVGPANSQVTLVGWGSTEGVILETIEKLAAEEGIVASQLHIKWIVPFHTKEVMDILSKSKHVIIVENNYSGQFARFLKSETGFSAKGHIRKYDGEPFMPHHIVNSVKEQLAGKTNHSVPVHEVMV